MKRPNLPALIAVLALTSCETMHDAAVSTFRVVDAPHQYVRRQLGMNEEDQQQPAQQTTTTTTTETYSNNPPQQQPFQQQQPPPPPPVQRQIVTTERQTPPPPPPVQQPTATPRVLQREVTRQESTPPPRTTSTAVTTTDLPYAKPVPGKPGYVFSPYDKNGGYVDVTGYSPGQKVKDPYSGKIFLVP
jgi:hypothetical protein